MRESADLGIALDGDADRLILIDEKGHVIDGDQVLALITHHWHDVGSLRGGAIAATQMSNLGLERFVTGLGLELRRTKVGDRYVMERMVEDGLNIGGEQSGHIILSDFATTGDGMLAALQVLAVLRSKEKPLSEIARCFETVPQELRNVPVSSPIDLSVGNVAAAICEAEGLLDGRGRLLVRPSGTEPIIRVMVEADDDGVLNQTLAMVEGAIRAMVK